MTLPPAFLDELRARVPVSDVVGRHVKLTRAGREHKGLCPFHSEKTPSFTVNDDKGFYHCFGCGAHGDVISFLRQHDRMEFMEAVEQLATMAGMEVPKPSPEARAQAEQQKGLAELAEQACRFFEHELASEPGAEARAYLHRRGLDGEAIRRFRLGFAPADSHGLINHLTRLGFSIEQILELGLARRPEDGRAPYAFFRNRVIFPVEDRRGRVVAFGGRLLDGDGPKYINSPDSALFHKGQLLYGLARARQAAGQGHSIVVVEGYMDVIALVRHGFEGAVAPLGTALTEAQIAELSRIVSGTSPPADVHICFDGDDAGERALDRALSKVLSVLAPGMRFSFATLPYGEDPDSLLGKADGGTEFKNVLARSMSLTATIWERSKSRMVLERPEDWVLLKQEIIKYCNQIPDRELRKQITSDVTYTWFIHSQQSIKKKGLALLKSGLESLKIGDVREFRPKAEGVIVGLLILSPSLEEVYGDEINKIEFVNNEYEVLLSMIRHIIADDPDINSNNLQAKLDHLGFDGELSYIRKHLNMYLTDSNHPDHQGKIERTLRSTLGRYHRKRLDEEISIAQDEMIENFNERSWERLKNLIRAAREYEENAYKYYG